MGRLKNGPLNGFTGKLGPLVGYFLNGEYVIRAVPRGRTKRRSEKEKSNHSKFAVVQQWLNPILPFLKTGFNNYGTKTGGYKSAVSYALKNSVEGTYPDQYINPEKILVSGGDLYIPANTAFSMEVEEQRRLFKGAEIVDIITHLTFTWGTENGNNGSPMDQVMLLAYSPVTRKSYDKIMGNFRSAGTDVLSLYAGREEVTYYVYLAFLADDRSKQSDSVYLGAVTVPKK